MDVEALLNDKQVNYTIQGSDFLVKCLNPEHDDSHPSMRIDRFTGVFHCFSCKFKGNLFKYYGKDISKLDIKTLNLKQKIMDLQRPRSIELPKDAKPFNRDYRGISKELLQSFGAFTTYDMEEMQDRIVFPLTNISGEVVALLGRWIYSNADPKYLVRPKKVKLPLFPAMPNITEGSVIIVEGIFDALNLMDKGLDNVVTGLGTSTISEKTYDRLFSHLRILGINKVYIMFDGDKAGNIAAEKIDKLFKQKGYYSEIIELEENTDPGDLTLEDVKLLKDHLYESSDSREDTEQSILS